MGDDGVSTFELARRMGLVRTRKVSPFLHQKLKAEKKSDISYYIVIDFESTCWADKRGNNPSPEIIEFPAVLFDAKNRTVPDQGVFQQYVMPTEQPSLSKFCTELTGITQDKVDSGCPLPTTIYLFNKWLQDMAVLYNMSFSEKVSGKNVCVFVTWTDWDLQLCLDNECRRKRINKPKCLDAWLDLKFIYQKFYGRRPKGLSGALKETGLDFDGREHSGLCDAKNTAKLLGKMLDDQCQLGITKTINGAKVEDVLKFNESALSAVSIKKFFENQHPNTAPKKTLETTNQIKPRPEQQMKRGLNDITNLNQQTVPKSSSDLCKSSVSARITPPLCSCGRRAKRLFVQKQGPNQGRPFFTCTLKKVVPGATTSNQKNGCDFFKWDPSDQGQSPNLGFSKSMTCLPAKVIPAVGIKDNKEPKILRSETTHKINTMMFPSETTCDSSNTETVYNCFDSRTNKKESPEVKKMRLSFNSPLLNGSEKKKPTSNVSLAPQYFGNVPLNFH